MAAVLLVAIAVACTVSASSFTPTEHGIVFPCQDFQVELAVASLSSFRISVAFVGVPSQWPSRMIANQTYPTFSVIDSSPVLGLNSTFGFITVNTQSGEWVLGDTAGPIIYTPSLAKQNGDLMQMFFSKHDDTLLYGAGGGLDTVGSLTANASNPVVDNRRFFVPHFWSTDGVAALGVAMEDVVPNDLSSYPAKWATTSNQIIFSFPQTRADLYVIPARTLALGTQAYYVLTGLPPVPPRYTLGFLASRWGWLDKQYIQETLEHFRNGSFPIDGFICDFEWYTPMADYDLLPRGSPYFEDFTYNSITFPDPIDQIREYHNQFHVRFGGIRKPRLGNSILLDMARERNWLIPGGRNLNYSIDEVRRWYGANLAPFLGQGVDFWWNDEGETQYYTFYDWNSAEHAIASTWLPNKRFFTINRSFSPGMQRFGTIVWTGDTPVSWTALQDQGGYLGNWMLAGAAYITCDIGGFDGLDFSPELMVRWYQLGVFMSVMRVHSTKVDRPHFPWLYGDRAAKIMRASLDLRHQLLPYIYSLAHHFSSTGMPYTQPFVMAYPQDKNASTITTQWLVGNIMPAPVVEEGATQRVAYLPTGGWFLFNTTTQYYGPAHVSIPVQWEDSPIFVREGSIITLANTLQYSDQLPGGPLHVYIYPGANSSFLFVEDDGETMSYSVGVVRNINFLWDDDLKVLQWTAQEILDAHGFVTLVAHGMFPTGARVSQETQIGASGRISF